MSFEFENLDARTRKLMLDEVNGDVAAGALYFSGRFTDAGIANWETLLRDACQSGNEVSLEETLGKPGGEYLNLTEPAATGSKAVPSDASRVIAGSEFNRFYIRALCLRAQADGVEIEIYRARASRNPDPVSEQKIGTSPNVQELLDDLRTHQGVATALGLPYQPNSGLSIRIVS